MRHRLAFAGMALALLMGGSAVQPLNTSAQDASSESGTRKVRIKVEPVYPPIARQMRLIGRVKLEATISADGRVTNLRVIGGSPFLVNAAMEALKQWRFEPTSKDSVETFDFVFDKP